MNDCGWEKEDATVKRVNYRRVKEALKATDAFPQERGKARSHSEYVRIKVMQYINPKSGNMCQLSGGIHLVQSNSVTKPKIYSQRRGHRLRICPS